MFPLWFGHCREEEMKKIKSEAFSAAQDARRIALGLHYDSA